MTPQLCLGTAQFGLAYGITNTTGQVTEAVVAQLLAQAAEAGVRWLDMARPMAVRRRWLAASSPPPTTSG